ncbi:hypothetical protein C4K31_3066 [Pseudomonas chlororaphis subsp. piscium]|nr:hypothetical protein C4K31_3066 [Pseudomonas chlororaphis subsp. piscium]AZC82247.1 hypothetical protein C4K30_3133 [Pseudomonas chlororaphis subsp. piscium]
MLPRAHFSRPTSPVLGHFHSPFWLAIFFVSLPDYSKTKRIKHL